ncbi:MAG: flagellar hook protein FlgE [Tissierellia bacterium]|nr:flagellar hook protein FlgE [Tissierellia bacterium]
MMRSMYSAISGLRSHQTKMDVIGNNIANVNTVGYKKQTVTFQEVFSQVIRGASAPEAGKGGTNPQQIGLGVDVGSINTIHTQGSTQRTDNPDDLMINGEGFFVVSDDVNLQNRYYTRAGNLSLDRDGNLVTVDGYKVLGYEMDENENRTNTITSIRINRSQTIEPTPTTRVEVRGNLDSGSEIGDEHLADTIIKDSLGNSYVVTFKFTKAADGNWDLSIDAVKPQTGDGTDITATLIPASVTLEFDEAGKLLSTNNVTLNITKPGVNFGDGGNITIEFPAANFTQYANEMDAKPYAMDGNSSGSLEGYTIDSKGVVYGVFSNGQSKALAQLVLAKFDNPMGLQKMGSNLFIDSRNSGEPQYGAADTGGFGSVVSGSLEMSNVDLAYEFTEMITTQRGFQANSRIITVSDEMLQELVNIKR